MSVTAEATGAAGRTPTAGETPTAGQAWAAGRRPALVVVLVLVVALVLGWAASGGRRGYLDPEAVDPAGSKAVVQVLRQQGVAVAIARTTASAAAEAADGATLLVAIPDLLLADQVARLKSLPGDLILVTPGGPQDWSAAIAQRGTAEVRERQPGCVLREAVRAGRADTGGLLYTATASPGTEAVLCYTDGGRASVLVVDEGSRRIVVLGSADILTNDRFDATGNAALALNLLGRADSLVWYLPVPEAGAEGPSLGSLVPDGVRFGLIQLALGVVLLALWRARRLGRVVAEPLPVEIRASEAVEGRGRLLRRARATDRAAVALRTATLARLRAPLGLPRPTDSAADRVAVVAAVAARTGRPQADVAALLYGGAPADDPALVRLADDLDQLDREVRRP